MAARATVQSETPAEIPTDGPDSLPSRSELEFFYRKLERALDERNFTRDENREATRAKIRRMFERAGPRRRELKLLHSMVRLMQRNFND